MRTLILSQMLALALLPAAHAATSAWLPTEGARMRLVVEDRAAQDGILRGALEIELQPGWKTYWRDPGDSGVPPQIDIAASTNISAAAIDFPPPHRFDGGYGAWAGYKGKVALPIRFTVPDAAHFSAIEADVFLGICDEICVPVQMRFSVTGSEAGDNAAVDAAFAALPAPAGAALSVSAVSDLGATLFAAAPRAAADAELFVVTPEGWALGVPAPAKQDGVHGFSIPVGSRPSGANGPIRLDYTLVSGGQAVAGTATSR